MPVLGLRPQLPGASAQPAVLDMPSA